MCTRTPLNTTRPFLPAFTGPDGSPVPSKYDLCANVVHEGKAGEGTYRVHVHRKASRCCWGAAAAGAVG